MSRRMISRSRDFESGIEHAVDFRVTRKLILPEERLQSWRLKMLVAAADSDIERTHVPTISDYGISLLPKGWLQSALNHSDAVHLPISEVRSVIESARKPYSGFPLLGVTVRQHVQTVGSEQNPALAFIVTEPLIDDEISSIDEALANELGVHIDRPDDLGGRPIVVARFPDYRPAPYAQGRLPRKVIMAAQSLYPGNVDLSERIFPPAI